MAIYRKLLALVITMALTVSVLPVLFTSAASEPRSEGLEKLNWNQNDYWEYRNDIPKTAPRALFRLMLIDSITPGGPYDITAEMRLTAITQATQTLLTLTAINGGEGKIGQKNWTWDNGTWATIVVDTGGDPGVNLGQTVQSGSYKLTNQCTGEMDMDMSNSNFKRGTSSCNYRLDAQGDLVWELDINSNIMDTTSNGIDAVFKSNWATNPLQVGDQWKQTDKRNIQIDSQFSLGGDIAGSGTTTITTNYYWDFNWEVVSMGPKTIASTRFGSNNFASAAQVTRSGGFDWDYWDGTNAYSGQVSSAPSEYWYACHGDVFDAGWFIEINSSTRILSSNHLCFRNSMPVFVAQPPEVVIIFCDENWQFINGVDYAVSDPDPGNAGVLNYSLTKSLGTNVNVLLGLTINSSTGGIDFTPPQHDVADGYTLTIIVVDNYEKGPLSTESSFTLNVRNKNHAPIVNHALLTPITMNEGDKFKPDWNLTHLIHDQDLDPNPLMNNQPYDPNEQVDYSINGLGGLSVQCPNGQDFGPANQCNDIKFYAPDGKFPKDVALKVNITATDSFSASAYAIINITVKHINHQPVNVASGPTELFTDVNVPITLDLQDYFRDFDVNNPLYITGDALTFQTHSSPELTIEVTGLYAKIIPTPDWCGKGNLSFRAIDKSAAYADGKTINITVQNCGPQFEIISWSPISDPMLQEAGTQSTTYPGEVVLSVKLNEMRGPLTYLWTVKDLTDGRIYKPSTNSSGFLFKTNYDENFYHEVFFGNDVSRRYHVSLNVSDGKTEVSLWSWNVTVKNTNRPPKISGLDIYKVLDNGDLVKVPKSPTFNYKLEIGILYVLDVTNYVSDADEGIENGQGLQNLSRLNINWLSVEDGINQSGAVLKVGAARTQAGYAHLDPGAASILTIKVTDKEGAYWQLAVSLKVNMPVKSYTQKTDYSLLLLVIVIFAVVVAIVYRIKRSM